MTIDATRFRSALAAWFGRSKRDLPWRRNRDPYRVWLSEVMLQQTTVTTVVPYFERFLERFPDVRSLADAPLEEVLSRWAGLGYYRRARFLHAAAKEVVERFAGDFPRDPELLRTLPGIGPYTSGAIASLAFDVSAPVVDGNVERVLSRLLDLESDARKGPGKNAIAELARSLVPDRGAGVHNEALIELGALVCQPGTLARCGECPVSFACTARARATVASRPVLPARPRARKREDVSVVVVRRGRVLVGKRRADEVWGGLFELPRVTLLEGESREDAARRLGRELLGVACSVAGDEVATARHSVMNERITLSVVPAKLTGTPRPRGYESVSFVTPDEWLALALPSPQRKVASSVAEWVAGGAHDD